MPNADVAIDWLQFTSEWRLHNGPKCYKMLRSRDLNSLGKAKTKPESEERRKFGLISWWLLLGSSKCIAQILCHSSYKISPDKIDNICRHSFKEKKVCKCAGGCKVCQKCKSPNSDKNLDKYTLGNNNYLFSDFCVLIGFLRHYDVTNLKNRVFC